MPNVLAAWTSKARASSVAAAVPLDMRWMAVKEQHEKI
jgi:hypothetical protein